MISCILPTRGRRKMAEQAVDSFLSQDYPEKELIVIDDIDQPSFPYGIDNTLVKYFPSNRILQIPEKRNMCCQLANGEWIAHFDSDDWSAPNRLSIQRKLIADKAESVIGFHTMLFWDAETQKAYKYFGQYFGNYALGSSLMYLKSWWKKNPWEMTRTGLASDNVFVKAARKAGQLISFDAGMTMVARIHSENSSGKTAHKQPYKEISISELPVDFPL